MNHELATVLTEHYLRLIDFVIIWTLAFTCRAFGGQTLLRRLYNIMYGTRSRIYITRLSGIFKYAISVL